MILGSVILAAALLSLGASAGGISPWPCIKWAIRVAGERSAFTAIAGLKDNGAQRCDGAKYDQNLHQDPLVYIPCMPPYRMWIDSLTSMERELDSFQVVYQTPTYNWTFWASTRPVVGDSRFQNAHGESNCEYFDYDKYIRTAQPGDK